MTVMHLAVDCVYHNVLLLALVVADVQAVLELVLEGVVDVVELVLAVVKVDVRAALELALVAVADVLVRAPVAARVVVQVVLDVLALAQEVVRVAVADVQVALARVLVVVQADVQVALVAQELVQDVQGLVVDAEDVLDVALTVLEDVLLLAKAAEILVVNPGVEVVIVVLDALDAVDVEALQFQFHQPRSLKFYMVKKEKWLL